MSEDFNPRDHVRKLTGRGGPAEYLDVKWRLVWFRNENPNGVIVTEHVSITDTQAVFKASVSREGGGHATGYGSETKADFGDFIEKAETKAIGRALNALGYGTQSMPDDGERIADAPVELQPNRQSRRQDAPQARPEPRHAPQPPHQAEQAGMSLDDEIIAGFYTSIAHATNEKEVDKIGSEIRDARLTDAQKEPLRAAWRTKKAAYAATA